MSISYPRSYANYKKKKIITHARVSGIGLYFKFTVSTIHHPTAFVRTNKLGVRLYSRTKKKKRGPQMQSHGSVTKKRVTSPQKLAHS